MSRYLRFVVHQVVPGERRPSGPFCSAYHILDGGDLDGADHARLAELLAWFESKLTVPPRGAIPEGALFWFADFGPFAARVWELARLLTDLGLHVDLTTARFVGRVVYRDAHQVAALPPRRHCR